MRLVGTALEFGMILDSHMERPVRELYGFNKPAVRRNAAEGHSALLQRVPVQ